MRAATLMPLLHEAISKRSPARGEAHGIKPRLLAGPRERSRRVRNGERQFSPGFKRAPPKALLLTAVEFAFFSSMQVTSPRDNASRAASPADPKATEGV